MESRLSCLEWTFLRWSAAACSVSWSPRTNPVWTASSDLLRPDRQNLPQTHLISRRKFAPRILGGTYEHTIEGNHFQNRNVLRRATKFRENRFKDVEKSVGGKKDIWLYCVECPQYSIWLEALCYLCAMTDTSRYSIVDRLCLAQRYVPCRQPAPDVAENLGEVRVCKPGKWLWIDSNGKNEN